MLSGNFTLSIELLTMLVKLTLNGAYLLMILIVATINIISIDRFLDYL